MDRKSTLTIGIATVWLAVLGGTRRSTLDRPRTQSLRRPSPASAGFTAIPTTSLSSTDRPVEIG
jgi:hypothetical protein